MEKASLRGQVSTPTCDCILGSAVVRREIVAGAFERCLLIFISLPQNTDSNADTFVFLNTWPDGAVYDGDFVNGQRQGHGKYTFADGGQYEGAWKDGRYDGFGECTWEDKRKYRGEWRNGMAHGRGIETYPNGNIRHEGQWIDDEPVR